MRTLKFRGVRQLTPHPPPSLLCFISFFFFAFLILRRMSSVPPSHMLSPSHQHKQGPRALRNLPQENDDICVVYKARSATCSTAAAQTYGYVVLSNPSYTPRALHSLPFLEILESLGTAISPPTSHSAGMDGLGIWRSEFQALSCCSQWCYLYVSDVEKPAHLGVLKRPTVS